MSVGLPSGLCEFNAQLASVPHTLVIYQRNMEPEAAWVRTKLGLNWTMFGPISPALGPTSTRLRANFGPTLNQTWADFGRSEADLDARRPDSTLVRADFGQVRSMLAKSAPCSTGFGPCRPSLGRFRDAHPMLKHYSLPGRSRERRSEYAPKMIDPHLLWQVSLACRRLTLARVWPDLVETGSRRATTSTPRNAPGGGGGRDTLEHVGSGCPETDAAENMESRRHLRRPRE